MKREILGCGVILIEMWERLSLRTRLLLPLGLMFVAALLAGAVSLQIFATAQLMEESEPAARSARAVCRAARALRLAQVMDDAVREGRAAGARLGPVARELAGDVRIEADKVEAALTLDIFFFKYILWIHFFRYRLSIRTASSEYAMFIRHFN